MLGRSVNNSAFYRLCSWNMVLVVIEENSVCCLGKRETGFLNLLEERERRTSNALEV
jgi:hypothetical protein